MNIDNIQALISKGLIAESWEIDPSKTFVQVGVFQPGNRQIGSGNANTYKSYAMALDQIMSPGGITLADNGLTVVGGTTVELGGTLIHDTQIDLAGFHQLFSNGVYPLLYLDPSKNWIGVGTNSPTAMVDIVAVGSGTKGLRVRTAAAQNAIIGLSTNAALTDRATMYVDNTTQTMNHYTVNSDTIFWNGVGLAQAKTLTLFTNTTAKFENYLYVGNGITLDGLDLSNFPISMISSNLTLTRARLQNQGNTQTDLQVANNGGGNSFYFQVLSTGEAAIDNRTSGNLLFKNGGTTGVIFDTAGNVGIGGVPGRTLDVYGNIQVGQHFGSAFGNVFSDLQNQHGYVSFRSGADDIYAAFGISDGSTWYGRWNKTGFLEANGIGVNLNTYHSIFSGTNNVGIGVTPPTAKLHVVGNTATSAAFALKIEGSTFSHLLYVRNDGLVSAPLLPTSNVGLVTGDMYVDTAANILANGDLVIGWKV